jgi:hypothetical protein
MFNSPIDYAVALSLIAIMVYSIFSMVRARRPAWIIGLIAVWAIGFIVIEIVGAFTQNTISENLVGSIPLPVMIIGTLFIAVVLCVHWYDLWKRRNPTGIRKTVLNEINVGEIKKMPINEFRDFGFLQEANRQFFHPLGLALQVVVDDQGNYSLGGIWDYRDDPEGIIFSNGVDAQKAKRVMALQATKATQRNEALGYVIQPMEKHDEQ